MPLGDLDLFLLGVTGEGNDFHAVPERRLDGIEHIRCRDKHHVRQIERHAEIVVAERKVLFRVQDLEQCGRRIASEVGANLVDFIHHEDRIVRSGLMQCFE